MFQALRKVVFAAGFSGLVAGLVVTAIQVALVIPMILQAEMAESKAGDPVAHVQVHVHADGSEHVHDHGAGGWRPDEGLERHFYNAVTNVLAGVGFACLLGALFLFQDRITWRRGLLWGAAGFLVFQLAPALGMPPELPGTASADLVHRQVWWVGTVAATAAGLALLMFARRGAIKATGAVLMFLPHLIGAPHPEASAGVVDDATLARFIVLSLATGGLFWLMLGGLMGLTFNRFR